MASLQPSMLAIRAEEGTRRASRQSWATIRWLVDRDRRADAFYLYAYFRWLDDQVDDVLQSTQERIAFIHRERALLQEALSKPAPSTVAAEEEMLLVLARRDACEAGRLHIALESMLAVMEFDASRRGKVVASAELARYTNVLAVAVTESLHWAIGHDDYAPLDEHRYTAVAAAHGAHMLRDLVEDVAAGYVNVPAEEIARGIDPVHPESAAMREWVRRRVEQLRGDFAVGRAQIARCENARCRLAGHAYVARFIWVLDTIEREGYVVRPCYADRKRLRAGLSMGFQTLAWSLHDGLALQGHDRSVMAR